MLPWMPTPVTGLKSIRDARHSTPRAQATESTWWRRVSMATNYLLMFGRLKPRLIHYQCGHWWPHSHPLSLLGQLGVLKRDPFAGVLASRYDVARKVTFTYILKDAHPAIISATVTGEDVSYLSPGVCMNCVGLLYFQSTLVCEVYRSGHECPYSRSLHFSFVWSLRTNLASASPTGSKVLDLDQLTPHFLCQWFSLRDRTKRAHIRKPALDGQTSFFSRLGIHHIAFNAVSGYPEEFPQLLAFSWVRRFYEKGVDERARVLTQVTRSLDLSIWIFLPVAAFACVREKTAKRWPRALGPCLFSLTQATRLIFYTHRSI